jgi:hypothetical protein
VKSGSQLSLCHVFGIAPPGLHRDTMNARQIERTEADVRGKPSFKISDSGGQCRCPIAAGHDRPQRVRNHLMRVIARLGYRLKEFAYLAVGGKATQAGNLAFPLRA